MGARGPARTPTRLLLLRDSHRGRKRARTEPIPPKGRPKCPRWLSAGSKGIWQRLIPVLEQMGCATVADENTLVRYVTIFDYWQQLENRIVQYEKDPKRWKQQQRICVRLEGQIERLEKEFGLSPASRGRLLP